MAKTVIDPVWSMGGVMKLGKALATGVAEERPVAHDEELGLPEEIRDFEASAPETVSTPEEAPVAR